MIDPIRTDSPDWQLSDNRLIYRTSVFEIDLCPVRQTDFIIKAPSELAPARYILYEWTDYRLRVEGAISSQVRLGSVYQRRDFDKIFTLRYENQLGRSQIRIELDQRQVVTLPVEVLSPKYQQPADHLAFYQPLLEDLSQKAIKLPFTFQATTQAAVIETAVPPSPLFVYNFFRTNSMAIRTALNIILAEPHRQLTDETRWVSLPEVTEIGPEVLQMMLTHPEYLVPDEQEAIPISSRMERQVPTRVWQRLPRETFDTPENRFVLSCFREFSRWLEQLPGYPWWGKAPPEVVTDLRDLTGFLDQLGHNPLFDEVGQMVVFPASSQVLRRRYGYRDLLELWRLFQLARRPFLAELEATIEARDVAALYEIWCFYELIDQLSAHRHGRPHCTINITDEYGLNYESQATWPGFGRLVYNRTFRQSNKTYNSYSVPLRPDFVFYPESRAGTQAKPIIFDAKFRFQQANWQTEDEDDQPDRLAKRADLYKMHTYRDALDAQAAIVLFPGGKSVFYDAIRRTQSELSFSDILTAEGVGAIQMEPGRNNQND